MESNGFILNILTIFDNSYILIAGIFEMRIHGMYNIYCLAFFMQQQEEQIRDAVMRFMQDQDIKALSQE